MWMGLGWMDGMVIIGHWSSKSTFGAYKNHGVFRILIVMFQVSLTLIEGTERMLYARPFKGRHSQDGSRKTKSIEPTNQFYSSLHCVLIFGFTLFFLSGICLWACWYWFGLHLNKKVYFSNYQLVNHSIFLQIFPKPVAPPPSSVLLE